MRMLDKAGVQYTIHEYAHSDGKIDGVSVAQKLGQNVNDVYKTLVTKGASGGYYVFVIPVARELDMKKASRAVGEKSVSMLELSRLTAVTGYVRGGCSPVGMKKQFPTVFDATMLERSHVMVSAGRLGLQVEVTPGELIRVTGAATADILEENK